MIEAKFGDDEIADAQEYLEFSATLRITIVNACRSLATKIFCIIANSKCSNPARALTETTRILFIFEIEKLQF